MFAEGMVLFFALTLRFDFACEERQQKFVRGDELHGLRQVIRGASRPVVLDGLRDQRYGSIDVFRFRANEFGRPAAQLDGARVQANRAIVEVGEEAYLTVNCALIINPCVV
jgi:hypothetical protein